MYKNYTTKPGMPNRLYHKTMLVMRLTTVILIASLMQVSAAGFAQKITLSKSNSKLETVLIELRKQTGFNFVYTDLQIKKAKPVSIHVKQAQLEDVLDAIFKDQPLVYAIENKTVVLKEKKKDFIDDIVARFQALDIDGKIVDKDGNPLSGATIKLKISGKFVRTNLDGVFHITGADQNETLIITYTGYLTREINASANLKQVVLELSNSKLDEVQVIAYGTTVKRLTTGSQAGIKADDIAKQPITNPLEALSGRIAGLEITQQSGMAGAGFTIRIRGQNSLRADANDPLIMVDGIPFSSSSISTVAGSNITRELSPLNSLNPADIQSIDVLKDADATAIYGSRGANGVILITTKKGTSGKTKASFTLSSAIGEIAHKAKVLDRRQYLDMRYEALKNDKSSLSTNQYAWDLKDWDTTRTTDWQKELLGGTAVFTNAQISISGGNENTNYNFGAGYSRQTSVYPTNFADQKYNGRLSVNHMSMNGKFKVQINTIYGEDYNRLPQIDLVTYALTLPPVAPPLYDNAGKLNWDNSRILWVNPLAKLTQTYSGKIRNFVSNTIFSYQIAQGLTLKALTGFTSTSYNAKSLQPSTFSNPSTAASLGDYYRIASFATSSSSTWNVEPQLEYNKNLGPGALNVLMGLTFQKTQSNGLNTTGYGFQDDDLLNNLGSANTISAYSSSSLYAYNALFARVGYNIKNKYIVNLTGRRDGSSRFGPGKQFGNFGAIGAAWIFTEEKWINRNIPFLSFGKLRSSYGITGNDVIGDYGFISTYSAIPLRYGSAVYGGSSVLTPTGLANSDYSWETNKKAEIALDLGFLKDRILFNVNYYRNRSSNMLVNYPLAATTGYTGVLENLPAMIQNKGFEFELNTINIKGENFSWSTTFNLSLPKNKLLKYDGIENSSYKDAYVVGQPLTIAKTINSYVDPQTGVNVFLNAKGEIVSKSAIGINDLNNIIDLGKKYYGGFGNNFRYKGFSLDILFQFSKQTGYYTNGLAYTSNSLWGWIGNLPTDLYENRWQSAGQAAEFQKLTQDVTQQVPAANARFSRQYDSGFYTDISYIRLKNVSFSYDIPSNWQKKMNIQSARIYLQGQNLLTFTKYPGMDPENQSQALPPLRIFSIGLQVTF